jgi:hypothetical protein
MTITTIPTTREYVAIDDTIPSRQCPTGTTSYVTHSIRPIISRAANAARSKEILCARCIKCSIPP